MPCVRVLRSTVVDFVGLGGDTSALSLENIVPDPRSVQKVPDSASISPDPILRKANPVAEARGSGTKLNRLVEAGTAGS